MSTITARKHLVMAVSSLIPVVFALATILLSATQLYAQATTYFYTGPHFVTVQAPYTTADSVTGYITLPAPLPANMKTTNILPDIQQFSFSDGVITIDNGDNPPANNLGVATGANGNIVAWDIEIIRSNICLGECDGGCVAAGIETYNDLGFVIDYGTPCGTGGSPGGATSSSEIGTWTVGLPPLQINTSTLPNAPAGQPYSTTLTASGGSGTGYTWSVISGSLPDGFTLSSEGSCGSSCVDVVLSSTGDPIATASTYSFTIQLKDSAGNTAAQGFTLVVQCLVSSSDVHLTWGQSMQAQFLAPYYFGSLAGC